MSSLLNVKIPLRRIIIIIIIISAVLFGILTWKSSQPLLISNITELSKIEKISKYRSCVGHTTVPQNEIEMKRSMKHYFKVKQEFLGDKTVEIYAPFDGYVSTIREDRANGLEGEIWIVPNDIFVILPPIGRWSFSVQHINIKEGLKRGTEVKAGEIIGYAAVSPNVNRDTFDVVYGKGAFLPKMIDNWNGPFLDLDSIFNHMSAKVLDEFQKKKVSKDTVIINKNKRDQSPCRYKDNGPYFLGPDDPKDWVLLGK